LGLRNSSAKLLPKFSTVISARGTVGKYCLLSEPMAYSQSNYGILPRYKDCFFFTYLLVAHSVDELQSAAYGSVFDTITTDTFKGISISLPKEENIIQFEESMKPFFFKILINQTQIRTLTALRDTLLPKLMSGEITVEL
jgi:type I restriction enzyme S subunit